MSIQTEITRINSAKADILTAIAAKGVEVPAECLVDDVPDLIRMIGTGSSGDLPAYTSGMDIWYDGILNCGTSHDANATEWVDLSGNNKSAGVTLTSGSAQWVDNGIDIATSGSTIVVPADLYTEELTMEFVINLDSLRNYNTLIAVCHDASNGYRGAWVPSNGAAVLRFSSNYDIPSGAVSAGQLHTVAFTYTGSTLKVYVDGVLVKTYTRSKSSQVFYAYYLYVCTSDSSRYLKGIAHAFRHYPRVLTEAELLNNYNLDAARFG